MCNPWSTRSSPTLTTAVSRSGATTCTRPASMRAAPTPPARVTITGSGVVALLAGDELEVGLHHHADELGEGRVGLPAQLGPRPRRVADQEIDLGGAEEALVDHDVLLPRQVDVGEGQLAELPDRVGLAGRDHEVARLVALQHPPHGVDVVAGEPPVPLGVEVAEADLPL